MRRVRWLLIVVLGAMLVCAAARAEEASVLLEAGVYAEEVVGDLDKAIETYEQIIADAKANRRYVAEAHYRLGKCYLAKGDEEKAREQFAQVAERYPDQEPLARAARQELEKLQPPAGPTGELTFGPVIECWVNDDDMRKDGFVDFDTGRLLSPTDLGLAEGYGDEEALFASIRELGIDAICDTAGSQGGLIGIDMVAVPWRSREWEGAAPEAFERELILRWAKPGFPIVMSAKWTLPATYAIKTREGGKGLLQILELRDQPPRGVKIRYKMVRRGRSEPEQIPQLPAAVMEYIVGEHMAAWGLALKNGLPVNTHIYGVDAEFNLYSGGLLTYRNSSSRPEAGPVHLGNFGPKRHDYWLVDEAGQPQQYELRERPGASLGKYALWWQPDRPVAPGSLRLLGYLRKDTVTLPQHDGGARLAMNNTFGSPVLESFFLAVPQDMRIAASTTEADSKQSINGFDVYRWQKEVPADTEHRVEVKLTTGAASGQGAVPQQGQ